MDWERYNQGKRILIVYFKSQIKPNTIMANRLRQPERIWNAKGSESKRAEKKERKGARIKFGTDKSQKKEVQILADAHTPN